jgi:hypothetical protein
MRFSPGLSHPLSTCTSCSLSIYIYIYISCTHRVASRIRGCPLDFDQESPGSGPSRPLSKLHCHHRADRSDDQLPDLFPPGAVKLLKEGTQGRQIQSGSQESCTQHPLCVGVRGQASRRAVEERRRGGGVRGTAGRYSRFRERWARTSMPSTFSRISPC